MRIKKRIQWLDFAKGIAILSVVMGHSITQGVAPFINIHYNILPIAYILFIFVMPVFFAVSGYLYENEKVRSLKDFYLLLYKKISSFLVPYIIFTLIVFIMNKIHSMEHGISNTNNLTISNFLKEFLLAPSYIWFLYALFVIFLFTGIMDLFHLKMYVQFIFYLILLIIELHFSWQVGSLMPAGICSFGMFFWIGEFMNKYSELINKLYTSLSYLFILTFIVLMYYLLFVRTSILDVNNVSWISLVPKVLSVPFIFKICQLAIKHENKLILYFTDIGKYTLIIYLIHFYIVRFVGKLLAHIITIPFLFFIIIFIIGWFSSISICKLSKRFKIMNFIFYTRKYINRRIRNTKLGEKLGIK